MTSFLVVFVVGLVAMYVIDHGDQIAPFLHRLLDERRARRRAREMELKLENRRLRAALELYARPGSWVGSEWVFTDDARAPARMALGREVGELPGKWRELEERAGERRKDGGR